MPTFTDKQSKEWKVELDAPTIEEIKDEFGVDLVDLEHDPLVKLRNNPMTLVNVISAICQTEIKSEELNSNDFARLLPTPPDPMLEAIREAIIVFFPSGQHSHVRAVLTKYDEMAAKMDELAVAKMQQVLEDPNTATRIKGKADKEIERLLNEIYPLNSQAGT